MMDFEHLDINSVCESLGKIAANYTEGSPEADALKVAAYAILFVQKYRIDENFKHFLANLDREPTEREKALFEIAYGHPWPKE